MIQLGPCEITGVFGPMASGKTHLINLWLKAVTRYLRFDATGESCDDPGVEHVWQSPSRLWARLKENPYYFRLAYHPGADMRMDFEYSIRCLWRLDVSKTLVCDEFHEVCSVNDTPQFVQTMMRYARHDYLAVIGASQRIADVHKLFTAGCRQVILFHTREARDLVAINDRWGKECADLVYSLRPLIYNDVTKVTSQVPQCVVIPRGTEPRVFDFEKDSYVSGSGDSGKNLPDVQLQDSGNEELEDGGADNGGDLPEVQTSDEGSLPG